jgi:hypothetical protein
MIMIFFRASQSDKLSTNDMRSEGRIFDRVMGLVSPLYDANGLICEGFCLRGLRRQALDQGASAWRLA